MARLVAIWYSALVEVRLGNAERVAAIAEEMRTLVDEFALAHGRTACRWFRGWADARTGNPRDGYRRIREPMKTTCALAWSWGQAKRWAMRPRRSFYQATSMKPLRRCRKRCGSPMRQRACLPAAALPPGRRDRACARRSRGERHVDSARARRGESATSAVADLIALNELCEHGGANAEDRKAWRRSSTRCRKPPIRTPLQGANVARPLSAVRG